VGADTIAHVVTVDSDVVRVRNPLPAAGGVDMEDDAIVRRRAPQVFRRQERAVTPADYAEVTERHAGVQRAAATLRWTGSWHTVFVTVDRPGGLPVDAAFEQEMTQHVGRYRMAGHDTEFDDPVHVSLEIDLLVCVQATHFRADVRAGLLQVLGSGVLTDGRLGLFHPDNMSFGQTVYLGTLYAAARQVAGVASLQVTRFQRQGQPDPSLLADGFLRLGRLDIPRLDNDPNFPEHGVLRLSLFGGKG
jgi:predicted phage baseplate assembly protein